MSNQIADERLSIQAAARAILVLLADREADFEGNWDEKIKCHRFDFHTAAWYNGRERGCVLYVTSFQVKETLIITFGEHRSSDSIFVDTWISTKGFFNPPTVADFTDEAYKSRKFFSYGAYVDAADYIVDCIRNFISIHPPPSSVPKCS